MTTNNPDSFFFPNPIAKQLAVTYFFSLSIVFSLVKFQWLFTVLLWNTHIQSVHIHIYLYSCVCRVTGVECEGQSTHLPTTICIQWWVLPWSQVGWPQGRCNHYLITLQDWHCHLPWTLVLAVFFFFLIWHLTCKLKGWDILIWYISIL